MAENMDRKSPLWAIKRSPLSLLFALCLAVGVLFEGILPASAANASPLVTSAPMVTPTRPGTFPTAGATTANTLPQDQGDAIARIATVLIVTHYVFSYDKTIPGTFLPADGFCTGEGVIVSSPAPTGALNGGTAAANALYILTDDYVTGASPVCPDLPDVPTGVNRTNTFKSATFFLNNSYSGDENQATLSFQITSTPTLIDVPNTTLILVPVPLIAGTRTLHDYPAVMLATHSSAAAQDLITLTNSAGTPLTNKALNPTPGAQTASPNQFLTPQSTTFASAPPANTPPGTPIIDAHTGDLLSVLQGDGIVASVTAAAVNLPALVPGSTEVCPANTNTPPNCLATRWKAAMNSFYQTPSHTAARPPLQSIVRDYPDFGGAQLFLTAATPQPTATTAPKSTTPSSTGGLLNSLVTSSKIGLIVLGLLVLLVIIIGGMVYRCQRSRQRARQLQGFPQQKSGTSSSPAYARPGAAAIVPPDTNAMPAPPTLSTAQPAWQQAPTAPNVLVPPVQANNPATQNYAQTVQKPPAARSVFCPECGLQQAPGAVTCPRCGYDLREALTRYRRVETDLEPARLPMVMAADEQGYPKHKAHEPSLEPPALPMLMRTDEQGYPMREEKKHDPRRLSPATELQRRYRIEQVVAKGGMGAVYRAVDQHFKRPCAVKEMLDHFSKEEDRKQALQWFEREAHLLLDLHHPAIPRVFDYFSEGDQQYLVMEFIEGRTLMEALEEGGLPGGLPEARIRAWAAQICNVLAYLHSRKPPIIFRDLKPANIMVTGEDMVKLIDFGIARSFQEGGQATVIMTIGYAPPEQMEGRPQPQSDLYALGATLHRLLTRHEARENKPTIFDFPPVRGLRPEISPQFEAFIHKALQRDLEDRWASAGEMEQVLLRLPPLSVEPSQ